MYNNFVSQRGPNKVPIYSMVVVAIVTITFIIIGDINALAPIVTMPFLITYASIDYSYFALAQCFDLQHKREMRYAFVLERLHTATFSRAFAAIKSAPVALQLLVVTLFTPKFDFW